tara:strand:+ start:9577 stop:9957 length:381 start_codon:yes stop_codon:yes gene_type:complete
MKSFKAYTEEITQDQLNQVEKFADKLFAKANIDVSFTRHFADRMNDDRNGKPITAAELIHLFKAAWKKIGKKMAEFPNNFEAVINDVANDVNIPFVINDRAKDKELVTKTIMRKKDFKSNDPKLKV